MTSDPAAENLFTRLKNRFSNEKGINTIDHLAEEIKHLHEQKVIDETEFSMLEGILNFQAKMVREVMVPRQMVHLLVIYHELSLLNNSIEPGPSLGACCNTLTRIKSQSINKIKIKLLV